MIDTILVGVLRYRYGMAETCRLAWFAVVVASAAWGEWDLCVCVVFLTFSTPRKIEGHGGPRR
jgi:hypothetical protein